MIRLVSNSLESSVLPLDMLLYNYLYLIKR